MMINPIVSLLRQRPANNINIWATAADSIYNLCYVFVSSNVNLRGYAIFTCFLFTTSGSIRAIYLILKSPGSHFAYRYTRIRSLVLVASIVHPLLLQTHLIYILLYADCQIPVIYTLSTILYTIIKLAYTLFYVRLASKPKHGPKSH